jgi:HPt (histidine-containing phosphotransfer) domain-containing protein
MSVLDISALDNLRDMVGGDSDFLIELINTFLDDAPRMLSEMRQGIADGDAVLFHRAAHSLKSNSAEFGATALSAMCRELETMSKGGSLDLTAIADRVTQVEAEFARVRAALSDVQG